jgi:hypothetical protein
VECIHERHHHRGCDSIWNEAVAKSEAAFEKYRRSNLKERRQAGRSGNRNASGFKRGVLLLRSAHSMRFCTSMNTVVRNR